MEILTFTFYMGENSGKFWITPHNAMDYIFQLNPSTLKHLNSKPPIRNADKTIIT